jgi:hypothetical protein
MNNFSLLVANEFFCLAGMLFCRNAGFSERSVGQIKINFSANAKRPKVYLPQLSTISPRLNF